MMLHRFFLASALVLTAACASSTDDHAASNDDTGLGDEELIKSTGPTSHWTYAGIMPTLESPRVTVSIKGHTAHAEGLLPRGFTGTLPFHAKTERSVTGRACTSPTRSRR